MYMYLSFPEEKEEEEINAVLNKPFHRMTYNFKNSLARSMILIGIIDCSAYLLLQSLCKK